MLEQPAAQETEKQPLKTPEITEGTDLLQLSEQELRAWLDAHRSEGGQWGTEMYYLYGAVQQHWTQRKQVAVSKVRSAVIEKHEIGEENSGKRRFHVVYRS